jgi:hypothetical protein
VFTIVESGLVEGESVLLNPLALQDAQLVASMDEPTQAGEAVPPKSKSGSKTGDKPRTKSPAATMRK